MADGFPFLFFGGDPPHGHLWLENFGPYKWFTMPLLGKLLSERGIPRSQIVKEKHAAPLLMDQTLRELLPWGNWDKISATQIRDTLSGNLVRLDKAIQVIYIIHYVLGFCDRDQRSSIDEVVDNLDIESSILPACYVIDNKSILEEPNLVHVMSMSRVFLSERDTVEALKELQLGFGASEFLMHTISTIAYEKLGKEVVFRLLEDRKDTSNQYLTRPILQPNGGLNQTSNIATYIRDNFAY